MASSLCWTALRPSAMSASRRVVASFRRQSTAASILENGMFRHGATQAPKSDRVMPLFSLEGRTAIVAGAGGGIGLAVARGLAEAGANVAIWYNGNKKAIERAEEIEKTFDVRCE